MPITRSQVNSDIAAKISGKTVAKSLTQTEDGANRVLIMDYVDQQDLLSEKLLNKSTNVATDGASDTKYPSVKSVKDYADGLVVGLLDDRGNYNASGNTFPTTGGSGVSGAILKGDLWFISVGGTLGGVSVPIGASVRALVDAPGQTSTNWNVLNVGLGFTPENVVNKSTNVTTDAESDSKYPSVKAVKTYVDANKGGFTAKTSGNIDAVSGSKATLEYDINTVNKDGGSEVKLPTTTEIGKEVLLLAYNYSGTIQVYANEAEEAKLSGGQNGISGAQGNLTINPREAYRFISLSGGYWYFEKIIDIPSNLYLLTSERSTNIVTDGASNFKVPSVKAVKDYVDANSGALPYKESAFKVQQNGTSDPAIYNGFIDQVQISPTDNANPLFRVFTFTRAASGQYYFRITWFTGSASAVNINKVDLKFADGNFKFTSLGSGSLAPYSWVQFNFDAYNAAGALSDNQFYTNFYVRLFN